MNNTLNINNKTSLETYLHICVHCLTRNGDPSQSKNLTITEQNTENDTPTTTLTQRFTK